VTEIVNDSIEEIRIGDVIEVDIEKVANGGFCIARHLGRVVFVRHAIPGERVKAEITDITKKFLRADAVNVVVASPHRVVAPCKYSGTCGGCDWQHVSIEHQRELKSSVIREQLGHLAKLTHVNGRPLEEFSVSAMGPGDTGLRWRTRNRYGRSGGSEVGLNMSRSHTVVEIDDCLIAVEGSVVLAQASTAVATKDIATVRTSQGKHVVVDPRNGPIVDEQVHGRTWHIHAASFWQVNERAPETFVSTVREMADLRPGESLLDLYSGAGLFAASLAADVGPSDEVIAVESSVDAVRDARRSCSDIAQLQLVTADVNRWVLANSKELFDVVVLDPPRAGAGIETVGLISHMAKQRIIYVACEPSALARDTAVLLSMGWHLEKLVAYDAFPMTAHVETIALFMR